MSIYQIIIFLTKTKIFATEINNDGKSVPISINGNSDIKCDDTNAVDELMGCLLDAFSVDSFSDDFFDIAIVDCSGDKKVISYLIDKCTDAAKLCVIGVEKLLPFLVWNKKQLAIGEEVVVSFADACYKVACDKKEVVRFTGKTRKGKEDIKLELGDFSCLYFFNVENLQDSGVDSKILQEKDSIIEELVAKKDNLADKLNEKENVIAVLQKQVEDADRKVAELSEEKTLWEANHPKPSDIVEQMAKVVEECKNEVDGNVRGDLYIKGAIPTKKIDSLIELYSQKFDIDIDRKSIVALYYIHNFGNGIQSGAYNGDEYRFTNLLFTEDYFCYDTDYEKKGKLIYWKDLAYAFLDLTYGHGDDVITFKFNGGGICRVAVKKLGDDNITEKFLIPLFNKLKDVDAVE